MFQRSRVYHFPPPLSDLAQPHRRPSGGVRAVPTRGQMVAGAMVANLAVLLMLMAATGLRIDWGTPGALLYYAVVSIAVGLRVGLGRSPRRLPRAAAHFAEYAIVFMAIGLLGAVGSYPVSAASRGFYDPALQHVDALLRFDWLAWYMLVAAHPVLQVAGRIAYETIYYTPSAILFFFAWTGRRREAHTMLATFWVASGITLTTFYFMPAVGPFAYLWHGAIPYMPASELWQPELIPAMRHGAMHVIDLGQLRGLVSAPSFHTTAAVLYIVIAWPYRGLRWPVLVVNAAMLLATPVEGTHYLADMLGGVAVALISLGVIAWLERLPTPRATNASGGAPAHSARLGAPLRPTVPPGDELPI